MESERQLITLRLLGARHQPSGLLLKADMQLPVVTSELRMGLDAPPYLT